MQIAREEPFGSLQKEVDIPILFEIHSEKSHFVMNQNETFFVIFKQCV